MRKMGKKITILTTACVIIVVVVFFEFYVLRLSNWQNTTINIIKSDPSAWVNKTVVVEGHLDGPELMMPDSSVPYNYGLNSSGQWIGVSFWHTGVNLTSFYSNKYISSSYGNGTTIRIYFVNSSLTVRIYGIVREGYQYFFNTPENVVYYIEAQEVEMA